ncbi:MAG: hypothetical protein Q8L89_06325 [Gammaproteobacteria bacterium]|nr:hypothetical protein [Gammaproteobacteria bacterium]
MALFNERPAGDAEFLLPTHPDMLLFLNSGAEGPADEAQLLLAHLDAKMIRVLDDLVDLLIEKQVILFTDLPVEARQKILARKKTRGRLQNLSILVGEADDTL